MKKILLIAVMAATLVCFCNDVETGISADVNDANAQFEMGKRYETGDGLLVDYVEAQKLYRKAAEAGHAEAQRNLGFLYAEGRGVETNVAEAVKWFRKAALLGDEVAELKYTAYCAHTITYKYLSVYYSDEESDTLEFWEELIQKITPLLEAEI